MVPVFIGGCPRSGTTLLGAMLGAHGRILSLPESPFIGALAAAETLPEGGLRNPAAIHAAIRAEYKFHFWQLEPAQLEASVAAPASSYAALIDAYVRAYASNETAGAITHWIDHTPENICHARRLADAFSTARFVHLLRDGRAVAASWLPLNWGPNAILPLAGRWTDFVAQGLAAEAALGERIRRVHYEELVTEPEVVLRRLSDWLGVPFEPAMLGGGGFEVPAYSRNQHDLIGRPADPTRLDRWKRRLRPREVELFEHVTGDLLPNLGYALTTSGQTRAPSKPELLRQEVVEKIRQLKHFVTIPVRRRRFLGQLGREIAARRSRAP